MKKCKLTAVIWKEGNCFVSKCSELGVSSYGRTPERARQALEEAVSLYIENARQLNIMKDLAPLLAQGAHYMTSIEVDI